MKFHLGEQDFVVAAPEPQPLGVEVDQPSAALYEAFAQQGRSLEDVYTLWRDPEVTNPVIRQRAVAVLTAPHGYDVPYPHPNQSIRQLLQISESVDGVETSSLRERLGNSPSQAHELAYGLMYWLETSNGSLEGMKDYQTAIRQLLPLVDAPTGDRLFKQYALQAEQPYSNVDQSSGYYPLIALLKDQSIPSRYKIDGLAHWFDIARQEEAGTAHPRVESERAVKQMAEAIQSWSYGDSVDDAVHTAIVAFLEKMTTPNATYIEGIAARKVADHITNQQLCFAFAWRHVVVGTNEYWGHFKIEDEADLEFVRWIRSEALRRGSFYFEDKADALMGAYEVERQAQLAKEAAEAALQSRLRA